MNLRQARHIMVISVISLSVANIYIEGYSPRALALTKTLSANEAENVFVFEYVEGETQVIETPGETITAETVIQYVDGGTTTAPTAPTGNQTGTQTPGTGTGETGEGGMQLRMKNLSLKIMEER